MKKTDKNRYMKVVVVLVLITTIILGGCSPLNDTKDPSNMIPILPGDTSELQPQEYAFYYKLSNENYIVPEVRTLTIPESKSVEMMLLQELVKGPASGYSNFEAHINEGTRIINVTDNGDILFVTLSDKFLDAPESIITKDKEEALVYEQTLNMRKTALNAIVATITELGIHSSVQIYIDYDGNGTGQRPTRREMGFIGEDEDQLIEPISRDTSLIFTPAASLELMMNAISDKDWSKVALYVDYMQDSNLADLTNLLELQNMLLIEYTITGQTVSINGSSAVIMLSYVASDNEGNEYSKENLSMRFVLNNGIYKCSYASLDQILNSAGG